MRVRNRSVDKKKLEKNLSTMDSTKDELVWLRSENAFVNLLETSPYLTQRDKRDYDHKYRTIKNCPIKSLQMVD